jgi:hypothetical protein
MLAMLCMIVCGGRLTYRVLTEREWHEVDITTDLDEDGAEPGELARDGSFQGTIILGLRQTMKTRLVNDSSVSF